MSLHISLPKVTNALPVAIQNTTNALPPRPKWNPECKTSFIDELQNINFSHLNNTLDIRHHSLVTLNSHLLQVVCKPERVVKQITQENGLNPTDLGIQRYVKRNEKQTEN